jgi:hypothetical protein
LPLGSQPSGDPAHGGGPTGMCSVFQRRCRPQATMGNVTQKPPRRHHVVNRAYLARFALDGMLKRVPLAGKPHKISVNNATVERDFYSTSAPELEVDAYESTLSQVEGQAEVAFRHVVDEGRWPTPQDRVAIAQWIAAQFLRTRAIRRTTEDIERATNKLEVGISTPDQVRERMGLPDATDEEVEDLRARMLATVDTYTVDPQSHLSLMAESMEGFINVTLARPWAIVRWQRRALATSDTPVVLVRDPDSPIPGLGFGSAGRVMVPLSRRVGLTLGSVGNREHYPEGELPGTTQSAKLFNESTIGNARQVLFHHPDDDPLAGFALPEARTNEMDTSDSQTEALIEAFARQQGRPSGLPTRPSESVADGELQE